MTVHGIQPASAPGQPAPHLPPVDVLVAQHRRATSTDSPHPYDEIVLSSGRRDQDSDTTDR